MRVLIAEDDKVLLDGLARSMRKTGYAVDAVDNGQDAADALLAGHHDLAILDIGLPKLDGLSVLRAVRDHHLTVPVILLTARDGVDDRVKGLDLGADDYLVKPFNLPELEARVRALLRRGQCGSNPLLTCAGLAVDRAGKRATAHGEPVDLSSREFGVLEVLITRLGKVVSKEQLIEHLYSQDEEASSNAIEVYIHRLRRKIEAAGVSIRTVRGLGYLMDKS
jgi:two-component system, OmpR family, response regulator